MTNRRSDDGILAIPPVIKHCGTWKGLDGKLADSVWETGWGWRGSIQRVETAIPVKPGWKTYVRRLVSRGIMWLEGYSAGASR